MVAEALSASATTGTRTGIGMAIGTPMFMAHEQALAELHPCLAALSSGRAEAAVAAIAPAQRRWRLAAVSAVAALVAAVGTLLRIGGWARLHCRLLRTSGSRNPIVFPSVSAPMGQEGIVTLSHSAA